MKKYLLDCQSRRLPEDEGAKLASLDIKGIYGYINKFTYLYVQHMYMCF